MSSLSKSQDTIGLAKNHPDIQIKNSAAVIGDYGDASKSIFPVSSRGVVGVRSTHVL